LWLINGQPLDGQWLTNGQTMDNQPARPTGGGRRVTSKNLVVKGDKKMKLHSNIIFVKRIKFSCKNRQQTDNPAVACFIFL